MRFRGTHLASDREKGLSACTTMSAPLTCLHKATRWPLIRTRQSDERRSAVDVQSSESGLIRVPFEGPPTRMTPLVTAVLMVVWWEE
jgi:hypothetical protein